jgi:hypothetical protein
MKKLFLLPVAALLVVAGCRDAQIDKVPTANAEAAVKASFSTSGEAPLADTGRSTVCLAYDAELERAQTAGEADLVADLEAITADACN